MPKVHFIEGDDWVDLYIDGKLVYSNHSMNPKELLDYLGIEYTRDWVGDEDDYQEKTSKYLKSYTTIDQAIEEGKLNPVFGQDAKNLGYYDYDTYLDEECK